MSTRGCQWSRDTAFFKQMGHLICFGDLTWDRIFKKATTELWSQKDTGNTARAFICPPARIRVNPRAFRNQNTPNPFPIFKRFQTYHATFGPKTHLTISQYSNGSKLTFKWPPNIAQHYTKYRPNKHTVHDQMHGMLTSLVFEKYITKSKGNFLDSSGRDMRDNSLNVFITSNETKCAVTDKEHSDWEGNHAIYLVAASIIVGREYFPHNVVLNASEVYRGPKPF